MKNKLDYRFISSDYRAMFKREFKKRGALKEYKQKGFNQVLGLALQHGQFESEMGEQSFNCILHELEWLQSPCVYRLPTSDFCRKLIDSKFDGKLSGLRAPNKSFILTIPDDFTFSGNIKIKSVLVCINTPNSRTNLVKDLFKTKSGKLDTPELIEEIAYGFSGDSEQLFITYDSSQNMRAILAHPYDELDIMLKGMSEKGFAKHLKETGEFQTNIADLDQKQSDHLDAQKELAYLIVSLLIYISCNDGVLMEEDSILASGLDNKKYKAQSFALKNTMKRSSVAPHYRNLRHEKFYKGKYADWERGTRWVAVNMEDYKVDEIAQ